MARLRAGDANAAEDLVSVFYGELRRLAAAKMRSERLNHTWQPTALVNELYLELLKVKGLKQQTEERAGSDKAAFFGLAAHIMGRLLLAHVRPLSQQVERAPLDAAEMLGSAPLDFVGVEVLLSRLADIDPMLREVVELKVFEGLTGDEIAVRMGCSPRSVGRYWKFAQAWLADALASRAELDTSPGH